jgi:hypothetical protein
MAVKYFEADLVGISPLLIGDKTLANPFHPLYLEYQDATEAAKAKQLDAKEKMRRLLVVSDIEFRAKLHTQDGLGPVIPSRVLHSAFYEAATPVRKGTAMKKAFRAIMGPFKLQYEGPRDTEVMLSKKWRKKFVSIDTITTPMGAVVPCTHPCFEAGWKTTICFTYDDKDVDKQCVEAFLIYLGKQVGIGSRRKHGFGRFEVVRVLHVMPEDIKRADPLTALKAAINQSAAKKRKDAGKMQGDA